MPKILLISEKQNKFTDLLEQFQREKPRWQSGVVVSEVSAQDRLSSERFDILLSDSRLTSSFSDSFLASYSGASPDLTNLLLCHNGDLGWLAKHPGLAHEYLDSDATDLRARFAHSIALHELLNGESPHSSGMNADILPTLPSTYAKIVEALDGDSAGIAEVARVVTRDVALSAKILHLVNSAYFGRSRKFENIQDAISLLGLETVKALTLTQAVFDEYHFPQVQVGAIQTMYDRCLTVGLTSKNIARRIGLDSNGIAQSFFAGLLHQIGSLVLLMHFPEQFQQARTLSAKNRLSIIHAENEVLGANHALLGSYLLATWRFPFEISDAVAYCEDPIASPSRTVNPLTAVSLAIQQVDSKPFSAEVDTSSAEYFGRIGLDGSKLYEILGSVSSATAIRSG